MKDNKKCHKIICCCNCKHQKKLMHHPFNKYFGKDSMTKQLGWVCTMEFEDKSNKNEYYYFDFQHYDCEMYEKRKD